MASLRVVDATDSYTIIHGDILEVASDLPLNSVQLIVTSPPYFRLRSYNLPPSYWPEIEYSPMPGLSPVMIPAWVGCLGQELDPFAYIGHLVYVFRLLKPILRDDGIMFINIGDTYAANRSYQVPDNKHKDVGNNLTMRIPNGLKPKDLIYIPARLFFALQADGWYGRVDGIWYRPNALPEGGVYDRLTRSHEYVMMFTKHRRYFYDWYHILDEGKWERWGDHTRYKRAGKSEWVPEQPKAELTSRMFKRRRDVLIVNTEPYKGGHTAAYPRKLVELLVLAGSSPKACEYCGAPWKPIVKNIKPGKPLRKGEWEQEAKDKGIISGGGLGGRKYVGAVRKNHEEKRPEYVFKGWAPTCKCPGNTGAFASIVLDPFMGSGTTLEVATKLGRYAIGIDLNDIYCSMALERVTNSHYQPSLNYMGSLLRPVGDEEPDRVFSRAL